MTPKERVLNAYPNARCYESFGTWYLTYLAHPDDGLGTWLAESEKSAKDAWKSAADRLPAPAGAKIERSEG